MILLQEIAEKISPNLLTKP